MQSSIIPIFLSKLNIARQGHFVSVRVEYNVITLRLLEMFDEIGIIRGYHILPVENKIKVMLRYVQGSFGIFFKITQVSKSSKRVFVDIQGLYKLKERESGNNIYIISTPKGMMFDSECILKNMGGEVLLRIIM